MTAAELRMNVAIALGSVGCDHGDGEAYEGADAVIPLILEAASDCCHEEDAYPGECYDDAHRAIDVRIRALMPPRSTL